MFEIEAHYYNRKIYLSDGRVFPLGEILLRCFSASFSDIETIYEVCRKAKSNLQVDPDITSYDIGERAMLYESVYEQLFDIAEKLPPYDKKHFRRGVLQNLFNFYEPIFDFEQPRKTDEDDDNYDEDEYVDFEAPLPSDGYITEKLYLLKPLKEFHIEEKYAFYSPISHQQYIEFVGRVERITQEFLDFASDLMRIRRTLIPFADELCNHNNYPSDEKVRECFLKYSQILSVSDKYKNLISNGSISVGHTVIETEKAPILCETYRFTSLGAYLYFELFKCIEEKHIPVKCSNCGRWFIMKHTTFSHFCTRAVSSNPLRTCRDVGFRKSYAEKIKSDPVWLIYTRAYKQHYARFMKKTMSKTEFAQWAEYALDLRQKALDGEIGVEEYTELIRK